MTKLNCPNCGAPLEFAKESGVFFCMYCGQKINKSDPNKQTIEFIHREINDADIRQVEAIENTSLKQIEMIEEHNRNVLLIRRRILRIWLVSLVVLFVLSCIPVTAYNGGRILFAVDILAGGVIVPVLLLFFREKKK